MIKCIVRMEMPENCTCCPMCFTADVEGYHWCATLEHEVEECLNRPKECPIEREFVTCEDCVHEDAARRGVCLYDWDICIGGVRKAK